MIQKQAAKVSRIPVIEALASVSFDILGSLIELNEVAPH